ncbi:hemerythrin domain-containing protein [Oceanicola sp. 502str15]|uniref:hemerythrin domain-containing protein n=1 Tax=Oceanicola sp. 502str15 TaxID=2696061 RepID=UPI00209555DE|nr:hemerythrin domain-containing protein [Oceanicola sp. 502str15]MCO6383689.1 hemerythrin domain-containing protein [Oceanicola sp. 502str15]
MTPDPTLNLPDRETLPDALRILLADYPRDTWEAHPHFAGLVEFWLDRHLMFRKLLGLLNTETQSLLDGADPARFGTALPRYGGMLLQQLHGHHQIEDQHYFPILQQKAPGIARGFELMEADHVQLDPALAAFADTANAALSKIAEGGNAKDSVAPFAASLESLGKLLDRHLTDEEELVVPVVLKLGPDTIG